MIRKITEKDINKANQLLSEFNCSVEDYKDNPFVNILMYDDKGIVVYTRIYDRIEIEYIIVDKKYQRNGIGISLLDYIYKNNSDITNMTLEVKESNKKAISFYENWGFEKVAYRDNYYGKEKAILMMRKFDNDEK